MRVVVDSCIIIDYLRQTDKQQTDLYQLVLGKHDLFVSLITHTELYAGKSVWETKLAKKELIKLLNLLEILPYNQEISQEAGRLRAKYNINLLDAIIAATSLVLEIPLYTLNQKDFKKIKGLLLVKRGEVWKNEVV